MPGLLYDANNVVVGNAVLWLRTWSLTDPLVVPPDTTVLFTTDWWEENGWFGAGATNEGFRLNVETSTTTVTIEEQQTPVGETVEGKTVTIEAALAEDTMESMRLAFGGSTITKSAGKEVMTLSDDINYYAAILEMRNKFGLARRVIVPKNSVTGSGEVSFRRAADKRSYPLRVASLVKPSDIQIVNHVPVAAAA